MVEVNLYSFSKLENLNVEELKELEKEGMILELQNIPPEVVAAFWSFMRGVCLGLKVWGDVEARIHVPDGCTVKTGLWRLDE